MLVIGTPRNVALPIGKWLADDSTVYNGGKMYQINVLWTDIRILKK